MYIGRLYERIDNYKLGGATLKTILIVLGSSFTFYVLFILLNNTKPKIFSFAQKIPENWKAKWFIRWIVLLVLMSIVSILVVYAGLNHTVGATIVGFFIALTDLIFKKVKKRTW